MILFVGDKWLEKISIIIAEFNPSAGVEFMSATSADEALSKACVDAKTLVTSHGLGPVAGRAPDLVCPTLFIDGLSTLEVKGKVILGAQFFPRVLPSSNTIRLNRGVGRGLIDFKCNERFDDSIAELKKQETEAVEISDFILANYQTRQVVSGCDRPDPIVTVEMAKRIADKLALNEEPISQDQPWRTDDCAYRKSTRLILPLDAEALGLTYELDQSWFPALGGMINKLYDEDGVMDTSFLPTTGVPGGVSGADEIRIVSFLRAGMSVSPELAELFRLNKEEDGPGAIEEIERLHIKRDTLHETDRIRLDMAMLRWLPTIDQDTVAVERILASNTGEPMSEIMLRKIANIARSKSDLAQIDQVLGLFEQSESTKHPGYDKLKNRREFLLTKQEK